MKMFNKNELISPYTEAEQIYGLCEKDLLKSLNILEKQMNVLQSRAQVLMSLAGVVLTITGFSGRRIAGTSHFAQICIIIGLAVVLLSAIWIWRKVLSIKWLTNNLGGEPLEVLERIILRRNRKTKAYMTGGLVLCCGFVIYSIAFTKMLLFNVK
jgi:hypothetical protein